MLSRDPHASLDVTLDAYLENGSNYETVRLIALSDTVLGRDENYDVLFDSALEAIREHPGTYFRGVADTFWEFLVQKPLREDVAPRAQTAPEPPAPTFESDGVVLPNPQATVLVDGVPYGFVWCASDYIDSCTLADPSQVWGDPAQQERYREIVAQVRAWDAELPSRQGWTSSPRSSTGSRRASRRPPLWLAVGRRRAARASPARLAHDRRALGGRVPRPARPRRLAGRRARVRAAPLPGLHRRPRSRAVAGERRPDRQLASTG